MLDWPADCGSALSTRLPEIGHLKSASFWCPSWDIFTGLTEASLLEPIQKSDLVWFCWDKIALSAAPIQIAATLKGLQAEGRAAATNASLIMEIQMKFVATARLKTGSAVRRFVVSGALIIAWLLLMPFAPGMPTAGLDGSWPYALNEAIARGYVFGRDVIFTFGPLASVYTRLYSPATDTMMLVGSAIYAAGICAMLGLAAYPRRDLMTLLVPILIILCPLIDSIFIALPFSLLLNLVRLGLPSESRFHLRPSLPVILAVAVATVAVGIEPIIKASFAGVELPFGILAFATLLFTNWRAAIAFSALLGLSLISAWTLSGQPLQALPLFFAAEGPIISGYTEAMRLVPACWRRSHI
jgi:hypothetical protein